MVVEGAATAKGIDVRPTTPLCKCFVFVPLALWLSLKVRFSFGRKIIAIYLQVYMSATLKIHT